MIEANQMEGLKTKVNQLIRVIPDLLWKRSGAIAIDLSMVFVFKFIFILIPLFRRAEVKMDQNAALIVTLKSIGKNAAAVAKAQHTYELSVKKFMALYTFQWCFTTAAVLLIVSLCTVRFGGSPGKLLLGLQVVDTRTKERPDLKSVLLRESIGKVVSTALLGYGFIMAFRSKDGRALHDRVFHTVVIED